MRYVDILEDENRDSAALCVYHIMTFVHEFTSMVQDGMIVISEIWHQVLKLSNSVQDMELTNFFTAERKAELLRVIWARSKGRGMQSALAKTDQRRVRCGVMSNLFYCATLLDPCRTPSSDQFFDFRHAFKTQVYEFCIRKGKDEDCHEVFLEKNLSELNDVRSQWFEMYRKRGYDCFNTFKDNPVRWWKSDSVKLFAPQLREFAIEVLSICPASRYDERSFNFRNHFAKERRDRMSSKTFDRMMFCAWNSTLLLNNGFEPECTGDAIHADCDSEELMELSTRIFASSEDSAWSFQDREDEFFFLEKE